MYGFRYTYSMNKKSVVIFLFLILLVASALRLWNLSNNPAGFFVDEASSGLNAYSILYTGKDTHGKFFPVIFAAVGDYRDPVLIYSTVPFIAVFGLNEFSVRLVSAIYGILAVLMMYFVGKEYFNERIGLWSALILAISPWHVHFSRVGFQLITTVFWLLFSLYFLKKSFRKVSYFVLFAVGMICTFFTYSTMKIYFPFILVFITICYPKEVWHLIRKKEVQFISIFSVLIVCLLIYPYLQNGTFFVRWTQVEKQQPLYAVAQGYINHFSPQFLLINGDAEFVGQEILRHSILGVGELHWFQILFVFVAFTAFIYSKEERNKLFFFVLLLYIYPLGSIFTTTYPQATRSIIGVIPFTILTAYGVDEIARLFSTNLFKKLFYLSLLTNMAIVTILLTVALYNNPLQTSGYMGWQFGYKSTMEYFVTHESQFDNLLITHRFNMGNELLNFYNVKYKCEKCKVMSNPISIDTNLKQLFALREEDIVEAANKYPDLSFQEQSEIKLPNGRTELYIGTFQPTGTSF